MDVPDWVSVVLVATAASSGAPDDATLAAFGKRYLGWRDLCAVLEFNVQTAAGSQRGGRAKTCALLEHGVGHVRVTVEAPLGARGTEMFVQALPDGSRKQWLYMPATGQSVAVDDRRADQPFMGTDFSYLDLSLNLIDPAQLAPAGVGRCGVNACRAYEVTLQGTEAKRRLWLISATGAVHHVEVLAKGAPVKRLDVQAETVVGKYSLPSQLLMQDLRTGSRTSVTWTEAKVNAGLQAAHFDPKALNRSSAAGGKPR